MTRLRPRHRSDCTCPVCGDDLVLWAAELARTNPGDRLEPVSLERPGVHHRPAKVPQAVDFAAFDDEMAELRERVARWNRADRQGRRT